MTNQTFDMHLKQIKEILKREKVKLSIRSKCAIGSYDFVKDVIIIHKRLKNEYKILTILHELGHHLDKKVNKQVFTKEYEIPYEWMDSKMFNDIVKCEIRAWNNAEKLVNQLNIKISDKTVSRLRRESLDTYHSLLTLKRSEDLFRKRAKRYFK